MINLNLQASSNISTFPNTKKAKKVVFSSNQNNFVGVYPTDTNSSKILSAYSLKKL